jgi:hypothetical protein
MCARWSDDYADDISDVEPDMGGLINRTADNWRPLFTIADLIGLDWPTRIREAANALIGAEPDSDDSVLLADIRITFEARNADRLSSEDACEALIAMEGRPWAEYGKSGKPISKNQLAKRLKRFKIVPDTIRTGGKTAKCSTAPTTTGRDKNGYVRGYRGVDNESGPATREFMRTFDPKADRFNYGPTTNQRRVDGAMRVLTNGKDPGVLHDDYKGYEGVD